MGGLIQHHVATRLALFLAGEILGDAALVGEEPIVDQRRCRLRILRADFTWLGIFVPGILDHLAAQLSRRILAGERTTREGLARLALRFLGVAFLGAGLRVQRDGLLGTDAPRVGNLFLEALPFGVLAGACLVARDQHRNDRTQVRDHFVVGLLDRRPRQGVVVTGFAEFVAGHGQRKAHFGSDAAQLRGAAIDAEELLHGHFQIAVSRRFVARHVVHVEQVLHGSLAEGGLADDDAAAIILDRRGKDFGGRRGSAIDQHGKRAGPGGAGASVALFLDPAAGVADLHDRTLVDEQSGQVGRLVQRTATVVAQVHDDAIDLFLFQFGQQLFDIAGGALVVVVAAPARIEILVERWQGDHADTAGRFSVLDFDDACLGRLFLDVDLVAGQGEDFMLAVGAGRFGQDFETDNGALGTTDLVDHVVETPADHIGNLATRALADADDAVAGIELARYGRRAA